MPAGLTKIKITEVVRRLEQGVTLPFLCRGDNGALFVVKGPGHRDTLTLCREWIAGCLGRALGLPIPPFAMVEVPATLVESSAIAGIEALGSGLAFASRWVEHAEELAASHLPLVLADLKPRILLFDRWIRNSDRILGEASGNPNLLWTPHDRALHVIDHNSAFDDEFDPAAFRREHVFRDSAASWDDAFRTEMSPRLAAALGKLNILWDELPESWLWSDSFESVPTRIDRSVVRTMLEQPFTVPADFWTIFP